MDANKDIFLPDTTIKYKVLKKKLSEVYGIEIVDRKMLYLLLGMVAGLSVFLIIKGINGRKRG